MVFGVIRSLARSKRCSMSLYIMFKLVSDAVMISSDFSHVLTKMSTFTEGSFRHLALLPSRLYKCQEEIKQKATAHVIRKRPL